MKNQSAGDVVTIQVSDNPDTVQAFGQKSIYVCKGGPSETFQNRFNYAAGRYLTISGLKNKPELADIEGHVVGTDLNRVGHFSCSSDLFNQIYETDLRTYRANTVEGYTSDCPHRERLGYGEENFATAWGCGIPNYDAGAFYTKVVRDWCDVQQANGWINHTAPQINTALWRHHVEQRATQCRLGILQELRRQADSCRILCHRQGLAGLPRRKCDGRNSPALQQGLQRREAIFWVIGRNRMEKTIH